MFLISIILSDSAVVVSGLATIITAAGTVYTRYTLMRIRRDEAANKALIESLTNALSVERELNVRLNTRVHELEEKVEDLETRLSTILTNSKKSSNVITTKKSNNESRRHKA